MRILFLVWATKHTGLGHWARCIALAETAFNRGHQIGVVTNVQWHTEGFNFVTSSDYLDSRLIMYTISEFKPDWLIFDAPDPMPQFLVDLPIKRCTIDGIGHDIGGSADINISQGLDGSPYCAPQYVIIRRKYMLPRVDPEPVSGTFVFGGAVDRLELALRFLTSCRYIPANVVVSDLMKKPIPDQMLSPNHRLYQMSDDRIFQVMATSNKAAVHMGMITWELAHYGIAPHVFSYSEHHLRCARALEDAGYLLAYGKVGLPESDAEFIDFLNQPSVLTAPPVDGYGAERVIKLLETG